LIQAEEAGAYIRIRVMDDGVGIDAAAKERFRTYNYQQRPIE
jgi:sensor histidine kinase YesM